MSGKIVVGIDGTDDSTPALRWAAAEGELRGVEVEALHAWAYVPVAAPAGAGLVPLAWSESSDILDASEHAAQEVAREQLTSVLGPDHGVTVTLAHGEPAAALIAAAEGADLLVVGNRGRGSLAQALLGSTSAKVSDRAPCPVVVVRSTSGD